VALAARQPAPITLNAAPAMPASQNGETHTSTNSTSVASTGAPPAPIRLSYAQDRRLRYEIRRANFSYAVGRYTNVIYHSKRALQIDPGNTAMRDLLQRAEAAQSRSGRRMMTYDEPAPPPVPAETEPTTSDTEAEAEAPIRVSAPPYGMVRYEIDQGNAYMEAGKYDLALRKFLAAALLDPDNERLADKIKQAQTAKETMDKLDGNVTEGTSSDDQNEAR
jgi:tetratricopeptide (TPR) repeat protein